MFATISLKVSNDFQHFLPIVLRQVIIIVLTVTDECFNTSFCDPLKDETCHKEWERFSFDTCIGNQRAIELYRTSLVPRRYGLPLSTASHTDTHVPFTVCITSENHLYEACRWKLTWYVWVTTNSNSRRACFLLNVYFLTN